MLAVANMKIQRAGNPDDEMLFMDLEKIKEGHLFDGQVSETFRKFFSRVPTNGSKNPEDQAKVMEKYFEGWYRGWCIVRISFRVRPDLCFSG